MRHLPHLRNAAFAIALLAAPAAMADTTSTGGAPPEPAPAAGVKEQVLSDPAAAKAVEATFYQNCAYCHGSEGSGGKARKLQCRDWDPDYLFNTISKGKKRGSLVMPPWENTFDEKERWQLVAYILSLKDIPVCSK